MFTHQEVWRGIDRLAKHHGLTASGLARRAGLDPTTFNPSKRVTKQAKSRWPSTESLAKILDATQTPLATFVAMMTDEPFPPAEPVPQQLRCVALDQLDAATMLDESGFPIGETWDEVDFPNIDLRYAYAVEVRGDGMAPLYRDGDLLIVSPTTGTRRHDRVILGTRAGVVQVGVLLRRSAQRIELGPLGSSGEPVTILTRDVAWLSRIVWSSQ
jgi:phage repressor protein C with HTH and peptisase S24 domain